jgi:hypothetical protein
LPNEPLDDIDSLGSEIPELRLDNRPKGIAAKGFFVEVRDADFDDMLESKPRPEVLNALENRAEIRVRFILVRAVKCADSVID